MKLIQLQIENIKRIKAVLIKPGPDVTAIGGKNAQGKSSVLDSVEMALAGLRRVPDLPVRKGEEFARAVLTFDNGLVVKREFNAGGGSKLTVKDSSGSKVGAAQTFLDTLTGKGIAFDPLAFLRMEPLRQLETLKRLVGVDFTDIDDKIESLNKDRAEAGRDVTGRKNQIGTMEEFKDVPANEVSANKLAEDLSAAIKTNTDLDSDFRTAARENKLRESAVDQHVLASAKADEMVSNADTKIAEWEAYKKRAVAEAARLKSFVADAKRAAAASAERTQAAGAKANAEQIDTEPIRLSITNAEETNRKVRANLARRRLEGQFRDLKETYDTLTKQIEALHREKGRRIAAAPMPVEGLGIGLQGVLYNEIPFDQASSAEQYRVSTAMGFELCPKGDEAIRIGLIRDASLLDDASREIIQATAAKYDAQLILEVVTDEDDESDVDLIIDDGGVRAPRLEGKDVTP